MITRSSHNPWLKRFELVTAIATLGLIGAGGLMTSEGVGMAVPDWPTTYGYNMFLFPIKYWNGGIFYEHTHRLFGAAVGLLTSILAVWLWRKESRAWLPWLGGLAFGSIVLQGLLGGSRVLFDKYGLGTELGVFHATLAQLCLVLVSAIAWFTTDWWQEVTSLSTVFQRHRGWRLGVAGTTLLIFWPVGPGRHHASPACRSLGARLPVRLRQTLAADRPMPTTAPTSLPFAARDPSGPILPATQPAPSST